MDALLVSPWAVVLPLAPALGVLLGCYLGWHWPEISKALSDLRQAWRSAGELADATPLDQLPNPSVFDDIPEA